MTHTRQILTKWSSHMHDTSMLHSATSVVGEAYKIVEQTVLPLKLLCINLYECPRSWWYKFRFNLMQKNAKIYLLVFDCCTVTGRLQQGTRKNLSGSFYMEECPRFSWCKFRFNLEKKHTETGLLDFTYLLWWTNCNEIQKNQSVSGFCRGYK